jgi:hypothetical protein
MNSEYYEIKKSVDIGPNYRKITVCHPRVTAATFFLSRCAVLDKVTIAVADSRLGEFDCVISRKNPLFECERIENVGFPSPGITGFKEPAQTARKALLIAGGSGIGPIAYAAAHRTSFRLYSSIIFCGRTVTREAVFNAFPHLSSHLIHLSCWDTEKIGRPDLSSASKGETVLFAGPNQMIDPWYKSMLESVHFNV